MTSHARIKRLRDAIAEGDTKAALRLLALVRAEHYPKALLRPVLNNCHPWLDDSFLDLDLVPARLLLAPLLPDALSGSLLDSRRLLLTHGCDASSFVKHHLNSVLR